MDARPAIKIEVTGDDVEALARTLVGLSGMLTAKEGDPVVHEELPLSELVEIVRKKAATEGYKLLIVKADEDEKAPATEVADAEAYEPKAVKRRGRRTKAEIEAAKAAAQSEVEEEVEETEEAAPEEMVLWEEPAAGEPEEELSPEELEALKKETIKRLMPIYSAKGGKERIANLLKDYKEYASVSTIPAKHFPAIARRIDE